MYFSIAGEAGRLSSGHKVKYPAFRGIKNKENGGYENE